MRLKTQLILNYPRHWIAAILAACCLLNSSLVQADSSTSVGELELQSIAETSRTTSAVLLETKVTGNITGMITSIAVEQQFINSSDQWQHGRYVFPLPSTAAIDSLTITIGERVIKGEIQEKKQAKRTFEQAQKAGKKAGLLEQHRPNLFSVAVANIAPFERIVARITFIDQIKYDNDVFSYTFPTTLTPRYVPDLLSSARATDQIEAPLHNPSPVPAVPSTVLQDVANVTPPQTHDHGHQTAHTFSLRVSLNAGYALESVRSGTHRLMVTYPSAELAEIELANGTARLNADLTMEWQTGVGQLPEAQLFEEQTANGVYSLIMLQAPKNNATITLPKNVTFIIDSSGSMAGEPMRQAQQALMNGLQYLSASDRFNIVDFDSEYRPLFSAPQAATAANKQAALAMVNALDADGGTEMAGALAYALNETKSALRPGELRQIIFITDGAVYNEDQLFELIHRELGDARLFTVGIGSAPNAYFMHKAAQFGRGTSTMIANLSDVNQRVTELFRKISAPVLRDIKANWPSDAEVFPNRIPDLYKGEPLTLIVKSARPLKSVNLTGSLQGAAWETQIKRSQHKHSRALSTSDDVRLSLIWARAKIASLMDQWVTSSNTAPIEQRILELGLEHQLLTKFTSFVAVEQIVSKPQHAKPKHNQLPNLMPKGSTMPIPQTATWSDLLLLVGFLLILLGLFLGRKGVHFDS